MDNIADAELVRAVVLRNDPTQYEKLIQRYERQVYAFCFSMVCDWADAQDLTQETFVRAWLDLGKLREPTTFAAWIRRIAFGTCADWLKKFKPSLYRSQDVGRAADDNLDALPGDRTDDQPLQRLQSRELSQRLDEVIAALPAKYRVPFVLFQMDGMSHARAAEFLDLPSNTVMSRVHRAKQMLREMLGPYVKETEMLENRMREKKLPDDFSEKVIRLTSVTLELGVANVQRSVDFYSEALGFQTEIRYEEQGQLDWASIRCGTIRLFLHHSLPDNESPEAREARKKIKLYFRPDDAPGLHEALKAKGFAVSEPQIASYGEREFSMHDPDGYTIMFQERVT
jgi:RNA polymerase sigma-70 factor (ECF subfamily)